MADREQELAEKIEAIRKLAAENKGVDEKALIESLFVQNTSEGVSASQVVRGYIVSVLIPPFGLYYALKFWLRGDSASKRAAWACLILTVVSLAFLWWAASAIFSSPQLQSIQNVTPEQIQELTQ